MRPKGTLIFALGAAAVVAFVMVGYLLILDPGPHGAEGVDSAASGREKPTADVRRPVKLRIMETRGEVRVRPAAGSWRRAETGEEVGQGAGIRTEERGRALVGYGDDFSVEVFAQAEVEVERANEELFRLRVDEGLVTADIKPTANKKAQLSAAGSDAVVETTDGTVHLLTDGKGTVQTAVSRGEATVAAAGTVIQLPAGYQSQVDPGRPPAAPRAVPASLLLKVQWPATASTAESRHVVVGKAVPGARVRVGGQVVTAGPDGTFRVGVLLHEGRNRIPVEVLDVMGRSTKALSPAIELDTRAPAHQLDVYPNMWKR